MDQPGTASYDGAGGCGTNSGRFPLGRVSVPLSGKLKSKISRSDGFVDAGRFDLPRASAKA
jgi:hypothetical protein